MILRICHKLMFAGLLAVLLASCVDAPLPAKLPDIKSVTSFCDGGIVMLSAELEKETKLVSECGFMFGKESSELDSYPAALKGVGFSAAIPDADAGKQYFYRAYIGNGRNVIYSQLDSLLTPSEQGPENPDDSTPPESGNQEGTETPSQPGSEVPGQEDTGQGDTDVPESGESDDPEDFRYEIKVSYRETLLSFYHAYDKFDPSWEGEDCAEYIWVVPENRTMEPRTLTNWLTEEDDRYRIRIYQYSYLDLIEFEDPVVKSVCVRLADLNEDGEVSFEEAAILPRMNKEDFEGEEITSFHEFQHFFALAIYSITSDYLFEGSSLRAITVRDDSNTLGKGMFKDCSNLETANVGILIVPEEAFMNCTSLKSIHARVDGARAYMGCTALETASQLCVGGVPAQAFKGCSNLKTFVFETPCTNQVIALYSIGFEAFYGCSSLTDFAVPRETSEIGDRAFFGCSSLQTISFSSSVPPTLGTDVFLGVNPDFRILVPSRLVSVYKSNWPSLADNIFAQE